MNFLPENKRMIYVTEIVCFLEGMNGVSSYRNYLLNLIFLSTVKCIRTS
jgi:hypothetical protein